jgi:ribosomal protein L11 methyltransferase
MSWCAVDIQAPAGIRDAVGQWLVGATGEAIEERDDGTLVGFLPDASGAADLQDRLHAAFGSEMVLTTRPLEKVDWSVRWRDGLGPRHFGRLVVTPSWVRMSSDSDAPTVVLDPEMAFGTGEHGSTRGALTLLERHLVPGSRVLDLGSGSGILAIAAVKLGAASAIGIELDAEANPIARRNAEKNAVAGTAQFLDGDAGLLAPLLGPADLILSNILRTVNVTLLPAIHATLVPGGVAIFSGMELDEAPVFRPPLTEHRFTILEEVEDAGWWSVAVRRP